ncbi:TPA: substrate-binding domain-containing protein [Streptococcus suis]|nr:substrate-binding domain-containing protein [Streptococcus suis]
MATTIKDLAKKAGVSTATVSRVLNNLGGYSPEVEERVLNLAKELHYIRNDSAKNLVKQFTQTVGVIMPVTATSYYGKIVKGIEDYAVEKEYCVFISHAGVDGNRLEETLQTMVERRVSGIIIFSIYLSAEQVNYIHSLGVPVVLLSTIDEQQQLPYLKVDDYTASYAAVDYLIKMNHRRIAIVGANSQDKVAGMPRIQGYKDALASAKIAENADWIHAGDFTFDSGRRAVDHFIQNGIELPTAFFCVSDEVALGVMSACHKYGIPVPDEVSVIGYDNSDIASMSIPALTTVHQPFYDMGYQGCKLLIDHRKEKASKLMPYQIIERLSVKKIE